MNEQLYARLVSWLGDDPVVVASVIDSRGATPRKAGSKMLISAHSTAFSIGGGLAEARVIAAARTLLHSNGPVAMALTIDLGGGSDAAGICGGSMQLALRRWAGDDDLARAEQIANALHSGRRVAVSAAELGSTGAGATLAPDDRLLIVGAGHCALAVYTLALTLDFDLWAFAETADGFADNGFANATQLHGDYQQLKRAFATDRPVYVVLLNRAFPQDVAALAALSQQQPRFIGMMGSQRRIHEVQQALRRQGLPAPLLHAPIGIELGAETPEEIAVSILAQIIQQRRQSPAASGLLFCGK
jgi:xanthine dehydrogenase accessory factor